MSYNFAILTASDRCSSGQNVDTSGPVLKDLVDNSMDNGKFCVVQYRLVPDDKEVIQQILSEWCDQGNIHCIITTGGTGFTRKDVTPEATKEIIDKEATGISTALVMESLKVTPMAMLSRLTAGIRKNTLIVNFPGSKKACIECFNIIKPVLKHALDQLSDQRNEIDLTHSAMNTNNNLEQSKVKEVPIANRNRHSPYEMISIDEAFNRILDKIGSWFKNYNKQSVEMYTQSVLVQNLPLFCGSILSEDVYASVPLPPFTASIKDGYAVIAEDGSGLRKVLNKSSVAGNNDVELITPGFCARISTGAALPKGANAVVQIEDTDLVESTENNEESIINIKSIPVVGQDIRPIGCDIEKNDEKPLIPKYTCLSPIEIGLIASTGVKNVNVFKTPTVAIMSTGDEVVSPGQFRPPNSIWDSNRSILLSLLKTSQYNVIDLGISPDNVNDIYRNIKKGLESADFLVTTGGVSMGERDLLKQVLKDDFSAEIHFGRVNLKPGKPTTFATCIFNNRLKFIFALPGNPVSAFVTYKIFVEPSLELIRGKFFIFSKNQSNKNMNSLFSMHNTLKCRLSLSKPYKLDSRPEFVRAVISFPKENLNQETPLMYLPVARRTENNQMSSRLLNVKDANALVLFESSKLHGNQFLNDGSIVDAILL